MTTIAWDGKALAADRAFNTGYIQYPGRKIFHIKLSPNLPYGIGGQDALVGVTGEAMALIPLIHWLAHGGAWPAGILPTPKENEECLLLVIIRRDKIIIMNCRGGVMELPQQNFVDGAGGMVAMGVLLAGGSAERAVELAGAVTDYSKFGVDSLTFQSPLYEVPGGPRSEVAEP